jgi:predicted DNA-binding transcriptional regulator AlpA
LALPKTVSPSKPPAAQVTVAKKAASVKAESAKPSVIAPDLIAANEQGDEALAMANPPASEHDGRNVHAARAPQARLGVGLLSKREVLAITNVSYPTVWSWMRRGTFPRSRVVGGKSMWVSTEIESWMAALPRCRLKGDPPPKALDAGLGKRR